MPTTSATALAAALALGGLAEAGAQSRPSAAAPTTAQTERGEPNVQRTVIEDDGSKIDELRVRGQVQRVTVTPKVGPMKSYEIVVGRGGPREADDGTGGAGSAAGKRVWNLLAF